MAMDYLIQVIGVLITQTQDASKKKVLDSGSLQVATGKMCNSLV